MLSYSPSFTRTGSGLGSSLSLMVLSVSSSSSSELSEPASATDLSCVSLVMIFVSALVLIGSWDWVVLSVSDELVALNFFFLVVCLLVVGC